MRAATVATLWALVALTGCEAIYTGNDLHGKHNSDGGAPDLAAVDLAGVDQSVPDHGMTFDFAGDDLAGVDLLRHLPDLGRVASPDGGIAPAQCPNGAVGTDVRIYDTKYATPDILARGDFNGDGKADVVAAATDSNVLVFLLGDGKGGFAVSKTIVALDCSPNSMAVLDLNKDGRDDIVVACTDDLVSILNSKPALGIGFAAPAHAGYQTPKPQALVTANLDGDGIPDLVFIDAAARNSTTNKVVGGFEMVIGNGSGTIPSTVFTFAAQTPVTLNVGDLNGDGLDDVLGGFNAYMTMFLSTSVGGGKVSYNISNIFLNAKGTEGQLDGEPFAATLGDYNKDGKLDIAVLIPALPDNEIQYALNTGTATAPKFPTMAPSLSYDDATGTEIGSGDFDCNGYTDIFTTHRATGGDSGTFALYFPSTSGAFRDSPGAVTVTDPTGMVIYDFNGDGADDAVVGSYEADTGTNTVVTALISTAQ